MSSLFRACTTDVRIVQVHCNLGRRNLFKGARAKKKVGRIREYVYLGNALFKSSIIVLYAGPTITTTTKPLKRRSQLTYTKLMLTISSSWGHQQVQMASLSESKLELVRRICGYSTGSISCCCCLCDREKMDEEIGLKVGSKIDGRWHKRENKKNLCSNCINRQQQQQH